MRLLEAKDAGAWLAALRARAATDNILVTRTAQEILDAVRADGLAAVQRYSLELDGAEAYEIPRSRLQSALDNIPPALRDALTHAAENIRAYHAQRRPEGWMWEKSPGRRLGQRVRGLSRVGIYVPGGTAAYPSSVLMNALPARAAGVGEIVMVTPPTRHLNDAVLAAACIAGVDRVIAVGGVQAVGALAYGAGFIPRVDKIVGPGNPYVAAAKRLVYGQVDIDMVAGPSELLVLADETASPAHIAADLLSQAEHDPLACATLVTTHRPLARQVLAELDAQMAKLPRREICAASLADYGAAIVCENLDEALKLANAIAPEHLEVLTADPEALLPRIDNAGAIFLGPWSPEPLGDYLAGPSHVLPTSGSARFFSPLGVDSFIKRTSVIGYGRAAFLEDAPDILALARAESLDAHAASVEVRL